MCRTCCSVLIYFGQNVILRWFWWRRCDPFIAFRFVSNFNFFLRRTLLRPLEHYYLLALAIFNDHRILRVIILAATSAGSCSCFVVSGQMNLFWAGRMSHHCVWRCATTYAHHAAWYIIILSSFREKIWASHIWRHHHCGIECMDFLLNFNRRVFICHNSCRVLALLHHELGMALFATVVIGRSNERTGLLFTAVAPCDIIVILFVSLARYECTLMLERVLLLVDDLLGGCLGLLLANAPHHHNLLLLLLLLLLFWWRTGQRRRWLLRLVW